MTFQGGGVRRDSKDPRTDSEAHNNLVFRQKDMQLPIDSHNSFAADDDFVVNVNDV